MPLYVFGVQYNLHTESLCERPAVCGELGWRISRLRVRVYVLRGVSVITWPTAHETQAVCTLGHSRGDRREVVCLYYMAGEKCQYVSDDVCECFCSAAT